jgi:hypothetical protein
MVGAVRIELLPLDPLSTTDVERWRELAAEAVERNPFFEPEFVGPAARHLGTRAPSLLVVHDIRGWAACMPVRREAHYLKLPGPALTNWVHEHCFLGTPLMAPGRIVPAWRGLLAHVGHDPLVGFLGLEQLGEDGVVARVQRPGRLGVAVDHRQTPRSVVTQKAHVANARLRRLGLSPSAHALSDRVKALAARSAQRLARGLRARRAQGLAGPTRRRLVGTDARAGAARAYARPAGAEGRERRRSTSSLNSVRSAG